jgi:hypothetical protein
MIVNTCLIIENVKIYWKNIAETVIVGKADFMLLIGQNGE